MNFKPGLAHFFRISTTLKVLLEITTQVRPADLPLFQRQFIVSPPAVAADHPVNLDAQQGIEAISTSAGMDPKRRRLLASRL